MATDNIVKVRIGVPGPPGAGVSAAEKATFLTSSGANTFTAAQIIDVDSTHALVVRKADNTEVLIVDTTNKHVEIPNDTVFRGWTDDETTETFSIDANTGNAQFDGNLTIAGRLVGDAVIWPTLIDGGGSTITTGVKPGFTVPYNALITRWDIKADQSGSIVVDVWKDTYANYAPTVADSIVTSEKPTLSAAIKNQDTSLNGGSGWAVTKGDDIRLNVDSITTCQWVKIDFWVTRT